MKITVQAPEAKDKKDEKNKPTLRFGEARTALEFQLNNIALASFHRKFHLEILDSGQEHIEINVVDGHRKQHKVQIFNAKMNIACCSCDDFILQECRYCVHLAAIDNAIRYPKFYKDSNKGYKTWLSTLRMKLLHLPPTVKHFKQHYTFFDSYSLKFYTFGEKKPTFETVSTKTLLKLDKLKENKKIKYIPENFSDEGLLRGVNLYPYQKDVFKNMVNAQRAICSMTMGAGKTVTTIACYSLIDKMKPGGGATMLVIAPKSLKRQWGSEIKRTCDVNVLQIDKPTDLAKVQDSNVCAVTYQFLTRHIDKLSQINWDIVVVDEIQFVRNNTTKTWKAIKQVKSDFFFGLSGTVIENRLDDLFSIMEIINSNALGPKWKFDEDFQELQIKSRTKWVYKGLKNLPGLKEKLSPYMFSYDNLQLPPIQHHKVYCDIDPSLKDQHDYYWEEAKKIIAKSLNGPISMQERMLAQAFLLKARQSCNTSELITKNPTPPSMKINKFLDLVEEICIKNGRKLVVFSEWVEMLNICERWTKKRFGIKSVFFTGRQSSDKRQEAVRDFQTDPNVSIFYASDAGGAGLDGLQLASSDMIHIELPWNPARLDQRTARIYRIGQNNNCNVYYLISKGTIENHINGLLEEKKNIRVQTLAEFNVM